MADEKFDKVKYKNEFITRAYDRINLTVPKGKKETIKSHSGSTQESVNGFINRAIDETIQRDIEKAKTSK